MSPTIQKLFWYATSMKYSMLLISFFLLLFVGVSVFAQSIYVTDFSSYLSSLGYTDISFGVCVGGAEKFSGSDLGLRITEIGFDGTDEWLEVTNFGPPLENISLLLSGAKSKVVTVSGVTLATAESVILGDTLAQLVDYTGQIITGLGLSIPDSTGFIIQLLSQSGLLLDQANFSQYEISSLPDGATLSLYDLTSLYGENQFAPEQFVRHQTTQEYSTLVATTANPGAIFCSILIDAGEDSSIDITGSMSTGSNNTGDYITDDIYEQVDTGTINENTGTSEQDIFTGSMGDTPSTTGSAANITGDTTPTTGVQSDITGDISLTTGETENLSLLSSPAICSFSEIHSVVDILPEFIELYCETAFSGDIMFSGIGVGSATKHLSVQIPAGGYAVFTSNPGSFYSPIVTYYITGMSLVDAGETISFTGSLLTGSSLQAVEGKIISYPSTKKGESYYPMCFTPFVQYKLFDVSTPGEEYPCEIIPPIVQTSPIIPPVTIQQTTPKTTSDTVTTTTKTTAIKSSTGSIVKPATTKTTTTTKPTTTTKTTSSSTKTTTLKPTTTKSTSKTTSTTKKTTTKSSTTTKAPTKTQQILQKEHDVYKNYIDFLHSYLKSHLYNQYATLKIPAIQKMLQKSLQTAKKNSIIIPYSGGESISILDFQAQWGRLLTGEMTVDSVLLDVVSRYETIKNNIQPATMQATQSINFLTPLVKKYIPYSPKKAYNHVKAKNIDPDPSILLDQLQHSSLFDSLNTSGGNLLKLDTGSDIMDTKTSEMNFSD